MILRILSIFLCSSALAADLRFAWDANDPAEEVIAYRLYAATNVLGPYILVGTTTNGTQTNLTLTNAFRGQAFYYLTAANFWTNSEPSEIVGTPKLVSAVGGTTLRLVQPAKSLRMPPVPPK
jgi:hypothetical protein